MIKKKYEWIGLAFQYDKIYMNDKKKYEWIGLAFEYYS